MAVIKITAENYAEEVKKSTKTVMLDFWADWCGPCRMLSPVLKEIAEENDDIKVCKINVDDQPELAEKYKIHMIPTVIVIKNGRITSTSVGYKAKNELLKLVKQ